MFYNLDNHKCYPCDLQIMPYNLSYFFRLDPSGRGQGDCELLDLPLSELNLRIDVTTDPRYDYYERDRNAGFECKRGLGGYRPYDESLRPPGHGYQYRDHHYDFNRRVGYQG